MRRLRIGMAQINTTVGDFQGNTQKVLKAIDEAKSLGIDLLTFPELAIVNHCRCVIDIAFGIDKTNYDG